MDLVAFSDKQIRRKWNDDEEKWYFSVIDIVEVLSGSTEPRRYWSDLKIKLKTEGSQLYEKIVQLKLIASDNKNYLTDAADTESIFRIIQSIPSSKAESSTIAISQKEIPETFNQNREVAKQGGGVAGTARKVLEKRLGQSVISRQKFIAKQKNPQIIY